MVAADILEVPVSSNNNHYLLVVQDYFTKWVEAIPLPDQTAARITGELLNFLLHMDAQISFILIKDETLRVQFYGAH